ncbi:SDR family NAD(P)-dependent oxidoreductase [Planosporangium flavigriseum]|uniref:Short-chain dehydrogenase n=1 Tax=Planosporangium flavigriseum TaxID=373681 RepID=A0A8J3LSM1_9ACTN|nr:SDR family NAD(P)-dependent oxidoreductase [Planosporangium flavigriseum]NJC62913.1 SDR family NAD(P)-dependent oxidoreductase [Planosporangium flavigriseum]GIG73224.1 short-chain dehydrogenase [Planosporangium flavigriseum]
MGFELAGRGATAVVTGASSGIGAVYARELAKRGWNLVLVARRAQRLDDLAAQLSDVKVETLSADLAKQEDLDRVAERVARDDVALLVNNAGINGYGPFTEVDPQVLQQVLAVNVVAPTMLSRAALPGMLERGRGAVVNVASLLAFASAMPPNPLPWRATYAGTKGYVVTFTRTLAAELGDDSPVQLQVLCPGLTATEFHLTTGMESVGGREEQVHAEGGMPAGDVVTASLVGLERGEVVCVPGLEDPAAVERLVDVESVLRSASRSRGMAARYRS